MKYTGFIMYGISLVAVILINLFPFRYDVIPLIVLLIVGNPMMIFIYDWSSFQKKTSFYYAGFLICVLVEFFGWNFFRFPRTDNMISTLPIIFLGLALAEMVLNIVLDKKQVPKKAAIPFLLFFPLAFYGTLSVVAFYLFYSMATGWKA